MLRAATTVNQPINPVPNHFKVFVRCVCQEYHHMWHPETQRGACSSKSIQCCLGAKTLISARANLNWGMRAAKLTYEQKIQIRFTDQMYGKASTRGGPNTLQRQRWLFHTKFSTTPQPQWKTLPVWTTKYSILTQLTWRTLHMVIYRNAFVGFADHLAPVDPSHFILVLQGLWYHCQGSYQH